MNPIIVGAVPAWDTIKAGTASGIADLAAQRLLAGWMFVEQTLLPQAKNDCVRKAYEHCPQFTHLLFVDSDQTKFNGDYVRFLLEADKDICSGITVSRNPTQDGTRKMTFLPEKGADLDQVLVPVNYTGIFFTLIKKEVFEELREDTNFGPIWFHMDRDFYDGYFEDKEKLVKQLLSEPISEETILKAMMFAENSRNGATLFGEDINFCRRAKRAGFSIYVHGAVRVGHVGEQEFTVE